MARDKIVRFTLRLSAEEMQALERLQSLRGEATMEETIEKALTLYGIEFEGGIAVISSRKGDV